MKNKEKRKWGKGEENDGERDQVEDQDHDQKLLGLLRASTQLNRIPASRELTSTKKERRGEWKTYLFQQHLKQT